MPVLTQGLGGWELKLFAVRCAGGKQQCADQKDFQRVLLEGVYSHF